MFNCFENGFWESGPYHPIAYIESFVGSSQQAIWLQTYYKISSKKSFLKPFFEQTQLALYIPSRIIVHNWWSLWFDILYKKKKTLIELLKKKKITNQKQ